MAFHSDKRELLKRVLRRRFLFEERKKERVVPFTPTPGVSEALPLPPRPGLQDLLNPPAGTPILDQLTGLLSLGQSIPGAAKDLVNRLPGIGAEVGVRGGGAGVADIIAREQARPGHIQMLGGIIDPVGAVPPARALKAVRPVVSRLTTVPRALASSTNRMTAVEQLEAQLRTVQGVLTRQIQAGAGEAMVNATKAKFIEVDNLIKQARLHAPDAESVGARVTRRIQETTRRGPGREGPNPLLEAISGPQPLPARPPLTFGAQPSNQLPTGSGQALEPRLLSEAAEVGASPATTPGVRSTLLPNEGEQIASQSLTQGKKQQFQGRIAKATAKKTLDFSEWANIPRAAMTVADFGHALRQTGLVATGHPTAWGNAQKRSFIAYGSENKAQEFARELTAHPRYKQATEVAEVDFTDLDNVVNKEEVLYGQRLLKTGLDGLGGVIDKAIPIKLAGKSVGSVARGAGNVVRGSERSYTTGTNWTRMNIFDEVVSGWEEVLKEGTENLSWFRNLFTGDPGDARTLKQLGTYLNNTTGRGSIKGLFGERGRMLMSAVFFAPRLAISRFQLATQLADPRTVAPVRALIAKDLTLSAGAITSVMVGLKAAIGDRASIEVDPRSTDFGRLRVGNSTYDFTAGMGAAIRLVTRMRSGEYKNAQDVIKDKDAMDSLTQYLAFKLSPTASLGKNVLLPLSKGSRPTDFLGRPLEGSVGKVALRIAAQHAPLVAQEIFESLSVPDAGPLALSVPTAVFGGGVNTFVPATARRGLAPAHRAIQRKIQQRESSRPLEQRGFDFVRDRIKSLISRR